MAGPAAAPSPRLSQGGIGRLLGVLEEPPAASAGPLGLVHGPAGASEQGRQVPARPALRDPDADTEGDRVPVAAGDAGRDATAGPSATYQSKVAPPTNTVPTSSRLRSRSGLVRRRDGKANSPAQATG